VFPFGATSIPKINPLWFNPLSSRQALPVFVFDAPVCGIELTLTIDNRPSKYLPSPCLTLSPSSQTTRQVLLPAHRRRRPAQIPAGESSKNTTTRFTFHLVNKKKNKALNNAFLVFQGFIDDWKIAKDYIIIGMFLQHKDYKQVAAETNKDRSLMWRREKSLKLDQYFATKEIIKYIGEEPNV
jgi:hypothetical protein